MRKELRSIWKKTKTLFCFQRIDLLDSRQSKSLFGQTHLINSLNKSCKIHQQFHRDFLELFKLRQKSTHFFPFYWDNVKLMDGYAKSFGGIVYLKQSLELRSRICDKQQFTNFLSTLFTLVTSLWFRSSYNYLMFSSKL